MEKKTWRNISAGVLVAIGLASLATSSSFADSSANNVGDTPVAVSSSGSSSTGTSPDSSETPVDTNSPDATPEDPSSSTMASSTSNGSTSNSVNSTEPKRNDNYNNAAKCVANVYETVREGKSHMIAESKGEVNSLKAKNKHNPAHDHTNPEYAKFYNTGDLEFNHWATSGKETSESFRVNFGTDYDVEDGKLTVELPYENIADLIENKKLTFKNSSEWLENRYYRGVSYYDKFIEGVPDYEVVDNKLVFKFPNLYARTAMSMEFKRVFDEEVLNPDRNINARAEFTSNPVFKNIQLPGSREEYIVNMKEEDFKSLLAEEEKKINKNNSESEDINGYSPVYSLSHTILEKKNGCVKAKIVKTVLPRISMEARTVMDTDIEDYSNNGYEKKVWNENNHKEVPNVSKGPGNVEVQHWQRGNNANTKEQYWRFVYAFDYAMKNVVIKLAFPDGYFDNGGGSKDIEDTTNWLLDRYYPAVVGNSNYSNLNTLLLKEDTDNSFIQKISFSGSNGILEIPYIPARSALSFTLKRKFDTPQDFSQNLVRTSTLVTGDVSLDGFNDVENNGSLSVLPSVVKTTDISCSSCDEPPYVPSNPEKPSIPVVPPTDEVETPDKPVIPPKNPLETPDKPNDSSDKIPEKPVKPSEKPRGNMDVNKDKVGEMSNKKVYEPSRKLPKTSDSGMAVQILSMGASITAFLSAFRKRK